MKTQQNLRDSSPLNSITQMNIRVGTSHMTSVPCFRPGSALFVFSMWVASNPIGLTLSPRTFLSNSSNLYALKIKLHEVNNTGLVLKRKNKADCQLDTLKQQLTILRPHVK